MGIVLELLRARQWYKNMLVFLPILFAGYLFSLLDFKLTVMGFVCLCLASSSAYIINDVADREADRKHPEKRLRPIAAGKVSVPLAIAISVLLIVMAAALSFFLSRLFMYNVLAIFLLTGIYTFGLKKLPFADILAIATNFVLRAIGGAFIIDVAISPWLILCTFFLSLFLSTGKRASDLKLLGGKAAEHRITLKEYSPQMTSSLLVISALGLIMSYSLFSFMGLHEFMILSLPFALYVIFRYISLVYSGSRIARNPEEAFTDKRLMAGSILWIVSIMLIIYF